TEAALGNSTDLPYGVVEREEWLRAGNGPTQLAQNCSGKHASMTAVCVINGWPVEGYLNPEHPLQVLVRDTITELTGEDAAAVSTDGCGPPLFAHTLHGMARAYGRIAAADPGTDEGKVAHAMRRFPEMVAGEGRDVTPLGPRRRPGPRHRRGQGCPRHAPLPGDGGRRRPRRHCADARRPGAACQGRF